jgi:hypothetical protein
MCPHPDLGHQLVTAAWAIPVGFIVALVILFIVSYWVNR